MKTTNIKIALFAALLFSLYSPFTLAQEELSISLDGRDVIQVANKPPLITKAVNFTAKYIAEIQETISFNTNLTKNIGLKLSNSRLLFPMGNGDFIITDQTSVSASFASDHFQNTLDDLNISVTVRGAATPSLKRFFISSAVDGRDRESYEPLTGPQNTPVSFGIDDQLYELGHGVVVDKTRYARYNNWASRFTQNIVGLPTSAVKADAMVVGEGYSFSFQGQLALGPSAYFNLGGTVPLAVNFNFSKIIKSGKFEIIVIKSAPDKLLFSIRQARSVGNNNFSLRYGVTAGASLDLIVGSDSIFAPINLNIVSIQRTRDWLSEERFNAVYEIDLKNIANRNLYNEALSKFDFSLFDVFTMQDISRSSRVLAKFRNADIKLVLEQNEKARLVTSGLSTEVLQINRQSTTERHEVAYGNARFEGRDVETSRGSLSVTRRRSNIFTGKELDSFEFKAYEEYGAESVAQSNDVILLVRHTLFDSETINKRRTEGRGSIQSYVNEFNKFTPADHPIVFNSERKGRLLETTQALMEFYITRADIRSLGRLDPVAIRSYILRSFQIPNFEELSRISPSRWSVQGDHLNSMKNFALGFELLQASLRNQNKRQSSEAIATMLSYEGHVRSYALLFKNMLLMAGRTPLINITFTNTKLELAYNDEKFTDSAFLREGLVLSERLDRTFQGQAYYDDIHNSYLEDVSFNNRGLISFNFKRRFSGYIKIVLRKKIDSGQASRNLGEFIIDVRALNSRTFTFNLNGQSEAEREANHIYRGLNSGDIEIYTALSFDDRIYDELLKVK